MFSSSLETHSAHSLRASRNLSRVSALLILCFFSLFLLTSSFSKVQVSRAWKPPPSPSPGLPCSPFWKHPRSRFHVEQCSAAPDQNLIRGAVRHPRRPREGYGLAGVGECGPEELRPTEAPRWSPLGQAVSGAGGGGLRAVFLREQSSVNPEWMGPFPGRALPISAGSHTLVPRSKLIPSSGSPASLVSNPASLRTNK